MAYKNSLSLYSHVWKRSKIKRKGRRRLLVFFPEICVFLYHCEFKWCDKCKHQIKMKQTACFKDCWGLFLFLFYFVGTSAIIHGVACWDRSILTPDKKELNRLLRSSVLGWPLNPVAVGGERRMIPKISSLIVVHGGHSQHRAAPFLLLLSDLTILLPVDCTHHNWQYQRILNFALSIFPVWNYVNGTI